MSTSGTANVSPAKGLDEDFIAVWAHGDEDKPAHFKNQWFDHASAKHSSPELFGANALRRLYPGHSLVMTSDHSLNLLNFPGAYSNPLADTQLVTDVFFIPLARRLGAAPGVLVDNVNFGAFMVAWDKYEFLVFITTWQEGLGYKTQHFIVHDGPDENSRKLLLEAGLYQNKLHDEIWVFNQGYWSKDPGLWKEIQKADWKDVILKDVFKKALQKDVYGFFSSEDVYRELSIPWKRGLILYGPPGNGKTISVKTIMKTCDDKGFPPLYVKSFQSWQGEEAAMATVFNKARQLSPCVVVLEDLDSLINDQNRSFFLNQLDGLESNDGLLVIGTTNHFERLDPGLSMRPSRFDRKYLFDDPDRMERKLYALYWQKKLESSDVDFPDSLVEYVADQTELFSFAYLKEAFVSSLVLLAALEGEKPSFSSVLKSQIKALRKQLDKNPKFLCSPDHHNQRPSPQPVGPFNNRDIRVLLDALSDSISKSSKTFDISVPLYPHAHHPDDNRDIRILLDALSDAVDKSNILPTRRFDTQNPSQSFSDFKTMMDGLTSVPRNKSGGNDDHSTRTFTTHVHKASAASPNPMNRHGRDSFMDDFHGFNPFASASGRD